MIFPILCVVIFLAACETKSRPEALPREVSFVAAGDNLLHDSVLQDARRGGGFDFFPMYEGVSAVVKSADFAFVNEEGPVGIRIFPPASRSFPGGEIVKDLSQAGFNLMGFANNHAADQGADGICSTLEIIKKHAEMTALGLYEAKEEREGIRVAEKNGIRLAFLSYTESLNEKLPVESAFMSRP
jgi:poly-gamma-glutamate synthesis protein (capsule biosynthesis protein)